MKLTYNESATRLAALSYVISYAFYLLNTVCPDMLPLSMYIVRDIFFADQTYTNPLDCILISMDKNN